MWKWYRIHFILILLKSRLCFTVTFLPYGPSIGDVESDINELHYYKLNCNAVVPIIFYRREVFTSDAFVSIIKLWPDKNYTAQSELIANHHN